MRRINTTSSQGTAVNERFVETDGSETIVPAVWLNQVQEEIASFIEDSGQSLADNTNQLKQAVLNTRLSYDCLVAPSGTIGADFDNLQDCVDDFISQGANFTGARVLVLTSEELTSMINIPLGLNNIDFFFHPKSRYSKALNGPSVGFRVGGNNIKFYDGNFINFSASGDRVFHFLSTTTSGGVFQSRFSSNHIDVDDFGRRNLFIDNSHTYQIGSILNNVTNQRVNGLPPFHSNDYYHDFHYYVIRTAGGTTQVQSGKIEIVENLSTSSFQLNQSSIIQSGVTNYTAGVTFGLNSSDQLVYTSSNITGASYSGTLYLRDGIKLAF